MAQEVHMPCTLLPSHAARHTPSLPESKPVRRLRRLTKVQAHRALKRKAWSCKERLAGMFEGLSVSALNWDSQGHPNLDCPAADVVLSHVPKCVGTEFM